jgi:hypothetical protein
MLAPDEYSPHAIRLNWSSRSCASSIPHPVYAPKAIRSAKVNLVEHSSWTQVSQYLRYMRGSDAPTRSKGYSPREVARDPGNSPVKAASLTEMRVQSSAGRKGPCVS